MADTTPLTDERAIVGRAIERARAWLEGGCNDEPPRVHIALLATLAEAAIESEVRASVVPQERFDFVLAACREAQEIASSRGWALNEIATASTTDAKARRIATNALIAAAPQCPQPQISSIGSESNIPVSARVIPKGSGAVTYHSQPQAEPSPEVERKLRRLLAIRVAGAALYGDDGELQDNSVRPFIDFLRDSPDEISAKLMERSYAALSAEGSGGAQ